MDCGKCQTEHTFRLKNLDEDMREGKKALVDHKVKIEKIDEAVKSEHKRLDEIKEEIAEIKRMTETIYKLTVSVENIAKNLENFNVGHKDHDDRLNVLENAPGKRAYDLQTQIIITVVIAIVSALVGVFLGKFGVKP